MISARAIIRNIISDLYFFQNTKYFLLHLPHCLFNELLFLWVLLNFQLPDKAEYCLKPSGQLPEVFGMSPSIAANLQCDLGQVTKSQRLLISEVRRLDSAVSKFFWL